MEIMCLSITETTSPLTSQYFKLFMYFLNTFTQAGCDIRSVFNQISSGLNSDFSFFNTSCHTKIKEPSLSN